MIRGYKKNKYVKIVFCILLLLSFFYVSMLVAQRATKADLDRAEIILSQMVEPSSWDDALDSRWSGVKLVGIRTIIEVLLKKKLEEGDVIVPEKDIRKAFKKIFLKVHPDRFKSEEDKERAEELFRLAVYIQEYVNRHMRHDDEGRALHLRHESFYAPPAMWDYPEKGFFDHIYDFFNELFGDHEYALLMAVKKRV